MGFVFFFFHYAECVITPLHQSHCCSQITSMHLSSLPTVCQPPAGLSAPQHSTVSVQARDRAATFCCSAGSRCHKIASAVAIWLSDRCCSQAGSMGTAILLVLDVSEYISFEKGAFLCRILMEYLNSRWGLV